MISPILWNLDVNKILFKLNNIRAKVVTYADNFVILIKGKFFSTISEVMESSLGTLLESYEETTKALWRYSRFFLDSCLLLSIFVLN